MVRLIWRTDVHISDVGPASRTDDWASTVLSKLGQIGKLAKVTQADAVLDGGDFFHIKSPGRNTHDLIRRVAETHKTYPCPVYANVGNHDCVYGEIEYLPQQPLEVLFTTGVFKRCYNEHEFVVVKNGVKVRVVGIPYHGTKYDLERFARIERGDENYLVCMAHVLASPGGGSMFEGEDIIKYSDLDQYAPTHYCFGHWHKDQGVTTTAGGKTIINVGSLTRGSLSQDDLTRKPAVVLMEFGASAARVSTCRISAQPSESVFDLEGRQREELRSNTMDAFVESVKQRITADKERDLSAIVAGLDAIPDRVKERVLLYLERV